MSLSELPLPALQSSHVDEWIGQGFSRYYIYNIKRDIEEAVSTVEVYLRHYVQVPPLAGHLHKVEGMHLVMSLYNKLKEWQQKRKQMRDTFSDDCMNEKDCMHVLGLLHDIKSKVQEKLNVIKQECPTTINEEASTTLRSAELTKIDFEDYAAWCNNISYDPVQNPGVMPFVIHPNLNQSYSIPNPDNYYSSELQNESVNEDNVIGKANDYWSLRDSSSKLSMVEIYEHLLRINYSLQVCFIGIWQDDVYIKLGNSIPESIGPLSVYRSYTKNLFENLCKERWLKEINKMIDEDLKEWCESKDLNRKKLTEKQQNDFYKYEADTYRSLLKSTYPAYFKVRSGYYCNDSNKVNVALLSHMVYHQKGAEDFLKKCLLIEVVRDWQSYPLDNHDDPVLTPFHFFNERMFNSDDRKQDLHHTLHPIIEKSVQVKQDWYAVLRGAQSVEGCYDKLGRKHMILGDQASDVAMFEDLCRLMPELKENARVFPINDTKAEATLSSKYKTLRKALSDERERWIVTDKGELLVSEWEKTEYIPSKNPTAPGKRINNKDEKYRRMLQIGKSVKVALEQLRDRYTQS